MKISTFIYSACVAATVSAQTAAQLAAQFPTCALACAAPAIQVVGCDLSDYACHCANLSTLQASIAPCLAMNSTCTLEDMTKFATLIGQICALYPSTTSSTVPNRIPPSPSVGMRTSWPYHANATVTVPCSGSTAVATGMGCKGAMGGPTASGNTAPWSSVVPYTGAAAGKGLNLGVGFALAVVALSGAWMF